LIFRYHLLRANAPPVPNIPANFSTARDNSGDGSLVFMSKFAEVEQVSNTLLYIFIDAMLFRIAAVFQVCGLEPEGSIYI